MTEQSSEYPESTSRSDLSPAVLDLSEENLLDPTEREEKLKKGIKVAICGLPDVGKSVFTEALLQNLSEDETFWISAAPDGEGRWYKKNYNNPEVSKHYKIGSHTEEFIEDRRKKISNWDGPIMIIDIGGRLESEDSSKNYREQKSRILEGATHAVILYKDQSGLRDWEDFLNNQGIEVIAKLYSDYNGTEDLLLGIDPEDSCIGVVHHLDHKEPADTRATIQQVAGLIHTMARDNKFYNEAHNDKSYNPFVVSLPKVFGDLPNKTIHRVINLQDGTEKQIENRQILRSAIPMIYDKANEFDGQPVWLDGRVCSWEAIALVLAFEESGSKDIRLNGPDGFIGVKKMPQFEDGNTVNWNVTSQGKIDGKNIYTVHAEVSHSIRVLRPEELNVMNIPELPEDSVVVISTQGPNWFKASIASGYKDNCYAIAAFQPGEGSTIVWAKDKALLSKVINENGVLVSID